MGYVVVVMSGNVGHDIRVQQQLTQKALEQVQGVGAGGWSGKMWWAWLITSNLMNLSTAVRSVDIYKPVGFKVTLNKLLSIYK